MILNLFSGKPKSTHIYQEIKRKAHPILAKTNIIAIAIFSLIIHGDLPIGSLTHLIFLDETIYIP